MTTTVTRRPVPIERRVDHTAELFGDDFPMKVEPFVFHFASVLSADYRGGYWEFHELGNGAFFMAPDTDAGFRMSCPNGYAGELSADAFGVVTCLYVYSHLSFSDQERLAEVCARHYHLLREFAMDHAEVDAIIAATD
jgi:hypothetical protein